MTRDEVITWLHARVRKDEASGCLLWTMAKNNQGAPIASVDGKRSRAVRPWLFDQLVEGAKRGDKKLLPRCDSPACVNVEHLRLLTCAQMNRAIAARGSYSTPERRMAQRRNGAKSSPYSDALVATARQLRAEGLKLREIAAATSAKPDTISRWCLRKRRVPQAPGASVFHQ